MSLPKARSAWIVAIVSGVLVGCAADPAVEEAAAVDSAQTETPTTCGGDVTQVLVEIGEQVSTRYSALCKGTTSPCAAQKSVCDAMYGMANWDINNFFETEGTDKTTVGTCGLGAARGSVSVNGKCYFAGEVNYFLWGYMNRLCNTSGYASYGTAANYVRAYRAISGGGAAGRLAWMDVGWAAGGNEAWPSPTNATTYSYPVCGQNLVGTVIWYVGDRSSTDKSMAGYVDAPAAAAGTPMPTPTPGATCTGTSCLPTKPSR